MDSSQTHVECCIVAAGLWALMSACLLGQESTNVAPPRTVEDVSRPLHVVLLVDEKDHGPAGNGLHDYPLWAKRWASMLGGQESQVERPLSSPIVSEVDTENGGKLPCVHVETAWDWPAAAQFEAADVIVAYCYLDWTDARLAQVRQYLEDGNGLVLIHSATWTKPRPSHAVAELTGVGGFTRYRHGRVELKVAASEHPICQGLPESIVLVDDETYWPPTPMIDGILVVATSVEEAGADATMPKVAQPMFWCYQSGGGRVFGCVPGHRAETFDAPMFRTLLFRGIAWAAGDLPSRWDALASRASSDSR